MTHRTRRQLADLPPQTRDPNQGLRDVGLDELMIVNPGGPENVRTVTLRRARPPCTGHRPRFLMADDGALYEVIE